MAISNEETASYHDPLGQLARKAHERRAQAEDKYPPVSSVYDAFTFNCPAGPYVQIAQTLSIDDLPQDDPYVQRALARRASGWSVNATVSLIFFAKADKAFEAEVSCMCYAPEVAVPMSTFVANMNNRIKHGEHPNLHLNQEQFAKVMDSNGAWYLTKSAPKPKPKDGQIVFKSKRTLTESLVASSDNHRMGCTVLASIFWLVVIALVVWFVLVVVLHI
jgi:hypothetical protein